MTIVDAGWAAQYWELGLSPDWIADDFDASVDQVFEALWSVTTRHWSEAKRRMEWETAERLGFAAGRPLVLVDPKASWRGASCSWCSEVMWVETAGVPMCQVCLPFILELGESLEIVLAAERELERIWLEAEK